MYLLSNFLRIELIALLKLYDSYDIVKNFKICSHRQKKNNITLSQEDCFAMRRCIGKYGDHSQYPNILIFNKKHYMKLKRKKNIPTSIAEGSFDKLDILT